MNLYRCLRPSCAETLHQGFEFWADQAQCPKCGLRRDDPRLGQYVVPLHVIHFDPPEIPELMKGKNHRACDPNVSINVPMGPHGNPSARDGGTADPQAVTCPRCKQTEEYQRAVGRPVVKNIVKDRPVCCGLGPEEF